MTQRHYFDMLEKAQIVYVLLGHDLHYLTWPYCASEEVEELQRSGRILLQHFVYDMAKLSTRYAVLDPLLWEEKITSYGMQFNELFRELKKVLDIP